MSAVTKKAGGGSFRVGLVQMRMSPDPDENVRKAAAKVVEAGKAGAQVVCLPELYRSPYFCQREDASLFDLAEAVDGGPSTQAMAEAAKQAKVAVVVPIFERRAPGLYHNSAVIIDENGESRGLYRKMHIPDDPSFYEKFYFTPGDLGFRTFDLAVGRIGTLICWDQWYPEGARLTALQGAANISSAPRVVAVRTIKVIVGPSVVRAAGSAHLPYRNERAVPGTAGPAAIQGVEWCPPPETA
jgi:N-carbamoylputrescine amidase